MKKDKAHEGKENDTCATAHAIKSSKEVVGIVIRQLKMGKNHHVKPVPCSSSSKADRVGGLELNKFFNTRLKHESLDNVVEIESVP